MGVNFLYIYLYFIVVNILYYHFYPYINRVFKINPSYDLVKHKKVKRIFYIVSLLPVLNIISIVICIGEDFIYCFKGGKKND